MRLDHPTADRPKCIHCQSEMHEKKIVEKNMGQQLLGVFGFLLGFFALFVAPPFGTIVGVIVIIASLRAGYSKKLGWICSGCGYKYTR